LSIASVVSPREKISGHQRANSIAMKLPRAGDILTRPLFLVAAFAFLVTAFLPQVGFGVPLCGFYQLTDLPCFGCGMTRSLTCMARFELEQAWQYHPFGPVTWPFMVVFAVVGVRKTWSQALNHLFRKFDRVVTPVFWGVLFSFFVFGIWRMCFMDSFFGQPHLQLH
jgi:hypothetical protein